MTAVPSATLGAELVSVVVIAVVLVLPDAELVADPLPPPPVSAKAPVRPSSRSAERRTPL